MLEVDEDSRLGAEVMAFGKRYGAPDIPSDDQIADFYEIAVERLARAGIARYEISNFARPGFESRHNLKYWRREPYLGFGADAHSFDGAWRWQNPESIEDYLRGSKPERTPADPTAERFFLGLRLAEGITSGNPADWSPFQSAIERRIKDGLLETNGHVLRLTARGVLLSNEVFAEFVGAPVL
jgi:oxygen-independent coproporphyrinogen-3 oxidase